MLKVSCIECEKEHVLDFEYESEFFDSGDMGVQTEHIGSAQDTCSCGEEMSVHKRHMEYPPGQIEFSEESEEGCIILEEPSLPISGE